jgi:trans-2,3-dihydro-3-hydroxyanthranilate isomerase
MCGEGFRVPKFPFMQVDAFTDIALGGNPCAVVFDADSLNDETMVAVAREMNLSETAFVVRSRIADFGARYFTPAEEIPLAGHPTIATVFALVDSGRLPLSSDVLTISLELRVGAIPVDIHSSLGVVQHIVMSQQKPRFMAAYDLSEVLTVFGLTVEDALPGHRPQTVSTGTPQLMIPLRSLDSLRRAQVNIKDYGALKARADFFSAHLFCLEGVTEKGQTFARHFGVPPDLLEDPFTGSATGGMGAYLWRYGLLNKPVFLAEQGHWMNRPGWATVEIVGQPDNIETVKVGGGAVMIIRGELTLSRDVA